MSEDKRIDVMVDLETLSLKANCIILSVGACIFNIETGEILKTFYKKPDLYDQEKLGRIMSVKTVTWWLKQSDELRTEILDNNNRQSFEYVFQSLAEFIPHGCHLWANGATFDPIILADVYKGEASWVYRHVRDVRTIKDLASHLIDVERLCVNDVSVAHNALNDAIHQAKYTSAMWRVLKGIVISRPIILPRREVKDTTPAERRTICVCTDLSAGTYLQGGILMCKTCHNELF